MRVSPGCILRHYVKDGLYVRRRLADHPQDLTRRRLPLLALEVTSHAADTGVTLYEVSERVTFDPDPSPAGVVRRNATSPLQGFAALGQKPPPRRSQS